MTDELTGYAELIEIINVLPTLVREKRRRLGLTLRQAEAQCGGGQTTLHRYEKRETISQEGLVALLRWVGAPDPPAEPHATVTE